ncbi:SbcD DNA repair exonuclease [uncultured Caudovirales phage]|uniref:SbcD DNA repair exonuclease n=1 Tax=uncultured Caudovirales phage TaxID=2100421 RepID=A0A6J5QCS4_9CAUD|nr:SbcD DNA repair exonuclease [uncultured Caudovirales phage]CAB4167222.1 SbcD DNA repair exonuclease [uncultured Caudovirales phage]CAB4174683.1 SbcD DNA repair exonuclease [uncultured Caudovirales phage]CAB4180166.1 SbcD DNA repair exonuclease [uncultured Caudovirales phage]CAB4186272.1 SbcD DNA repair exonuclease [uncultured Caudovirales phage]
MSKQKITIVQCNDIHLADKSPASRKNSYATEIFEKVRKVVEIAHAIEADGILLAGDIFHNPRKISHFSVNTFIEIFKNFSKQIFIVPGNHDISAKVPFDHAAIATIGALDNVTILRDGRVHRPIPTKPWFTIAGLEWTYSEDENHYTHLLESIEEKVSLLGMHAPILDEEAKFWTLRRSVISSTDRAQCVAYGHLHSQAPITTIGNTTFSNPGALARSSINEKNNVPSIAMLDFYEDQSCEVEYVTVNHLPAEDVFYLEYAISVKEAKSAVKSFISSLESATVQSVDGDGLMSAIEQVCNDKEVVDLARDILRKLD